MRFLILLFLVGCGSADCTREPYIVKRVSVPNTFGQCSILFANGIVYYNPVIR